MIVKSAAPIHRPLSAGQGRVEFTARGGRTSVSQNSARSPLRLLFPKNDGAAAWVYSSSFGGGLLGGDHIKFHAEIGPGAAAYVSTQASTKVYRSHLRSRQTFSAQIADGGLLVSAPDPVVCFADSDYEQRQTFRLAPSASLLAIDSISSGRWANGERWAFTRLASRTEIFCGDERVVCESLRLDRAQGDIAQRMRRFNALCTAIVLGPRMADGAAALLSRVAEMPVSREADLVISTSPLPGGALLRIAAVTPENALRGLREQLSFVVGILGDDPWARKW